MNTSNILNLNMAKLSYVRDAVAEITSAGIQGGLPNPGRLPRITKISRKGN